MGSDGLWSQARALLRSPAGRAGFIVLFFGSAWLLFPGLVPPRVALHVQVDGRRCAERVFMTVRAVEGDGAPVASLATHLGWQTSGRLRRRLPRGAYVVDLGLECPDGASASPLRRPLAVEGALEVRYHVRDRCACPPPPSPA